MPRRTSSSPAAAAPEGFAGVVVATKLRAPPPRPGRIQRRRLVEPLTTGGRKLTVIQAPAGWGKTTVLADWQTELTGETRVAWLSLDDGDNDPVQFWTYVIQALQTIAPGVGTDALSLVGGGREDMLRLALPTLLNDLSDLPGHALLILDDYHLVREPGIHAEVAFVIDHLPPALELAIATRSEPPLPLARWRARGELADVRSDALRFTPDEAAAMLRELGLALGADDAAELNRRTEGWAAGLYLAALSLRDRADPRAFITSFAGDNRDLVDYLVAEVLAGQPAHMRSFLLRTSILRRLCPDLCEAVTGEEDAAGLLAEIDQANLFLMPLDDRREWYRYHQLFRQMLVLELERAEPHVAPELHQLASRWYRDRGDIGEAIHHALVADDIADAATLIHEHWNEFFNAGRLATVTAWLERLPADFVERDQALAVAHAWLALDRGELEPAGQWIRLAEAAGPTPDSDTALLRAVQRFKIGDLPAAKAAARQAVELEGDATSFTRTVAGCILGIELYWSGRHESASRALRDVTGLARRGDNHLGAAYSLGYAALAEAELGRLDVAEHDALAAIGESDEPGFKEHFVLTVAHLALAAVAARRGQSAAAEQAAERAVSLSQRGAGRPEIALALVALAQARHSRGNGDSATKLATESAAIIRSCPDAGIAGARALETADQLARRPRRDPVLRDELSARELAVLRLLSTPLSQREIGSELYVSLNTVKSHVRSIHRKLGTATRKQTVERARELHLV